MSDNAVAETPSAEAKTPAPDQADSTQDSTSLDDLLSQYDNGVQGNDPTADAPTDSTTDSKAEGLDAETIQSLKQIARNEQNRAFTDTMNSAINTMKEEVGESLPIELPDAVYRGMIYDAAEADPRVKRAYVDRQRNPAAFNRILKQIAKEAVQSMKVSKSDTDTRNEVNAAVRGARKQTSQPSPQEDEAAYRAKFQSMTPAEKEQERRRLRQVSRRGG